jgi:hypothetical protein
MERPGLVSFPAHALSILEERLRERQAEGELPIEADVTELALKILVLVATHGERGR